jgi:hypothetical protein
VGHRLLAGSFAAAMTNSINVNSGLPPGAVTLAEPETAAERMFRLGLANIPSLAAGAVLVLGLLVGIGLTAFSSNQSLQQGGLQLITTIVGAAAGFLFATKSQI